MKTKSLSHAIKKLSKKKGVPSSESLGSLAISLRVDIGQMATSAVNSVEVSSHKDTRAALGADLAKALDLARVIDLVEFKDAELNLLVLVLLLLRLGVDLLFTLLTTTEEAEGDVHLGVISDTAGSQRGVVLELATGEHHTLLLSGDALASLNGGLDISHSGLGAKLQDMGPVCKRTK